MQGAEQTQDVAQYFSKIFVLAFVTYLASLKDYGFVKKSARSAGGLGSIPGSGPSPGGGHGNPYQYSCLDNSMDRGV